MVRKGEKGIAILAPLACKKQQTECEIDLDQPTSISGFRVVHVFDISQRMGRSWIDWQPSQVIQG